MDLPSVPEQLPEDPAALAPGRESGEQELEGEEFAVFPGWKIYLLILALPLSSVVLYEGLDLATLLADFAKGALGAEAETVGWMTGVVLTLAPIAALIPLVAKLHRTYGGARWDERGLFLRGPLLKDEVFLPWESVQTLEPATSGVLVVPTKQAAPGLWTFYPFKPLIPVEPARRDGVLKDVAARAGKVQEGRIFGYTPHSWRSALIAFVIALPCVVTVMFSNALVVQQAWGIPADYLVLGATLATLVIGVGGALFSTSAFLTRIELHRDLLTCASYPFPFGELSVAIKGQVVWFETPSQKRRGYLRPGEGPVLRAALEEAGLSVGEDPPWRARTSAVLLQASSLILAGLLIGGAPAIWASLQPAHSVDLLWDPFEQGLVLVHERWTARPVHLVLTNDPQRIEIVGREAYGRAGTLAVGGDVALDAVQGTWSVNGGQFRGSLAPLSSEVGMEGRTHLVELPLASAVSSRLQRAITERDYDSQSWPRHPGAAGTLSTPQAVRDAGRTVPGFLESLIGVPEGQLGDFVAGRSSRRFYDIQGPDGELIAAVCNGRVLWVVVLPLNVAVTLSGQGFGYGTTLGAPQVQVEPGVSRGNLTGALQVERSSLPTLEQLLKLRRRVESKEASVEQGLAWLLAQPPARKKE